MERDEIKRLIAWLRTRVNLGESGAEITTTFDEPERCDFSEQGFEHEVTALTLEADWWKEMVSDIIETPDFAEPGDSPEQVLEYARDVVAEYIRKRLGT